MCVFVMDFYGGAVVVVVMDAGKCACVAPHCTHMCPLVGRCFLLVVVVVVVITISPLLCSGNAGVCW